MRIERDFLGEVKIPKDALYGINAVRASFNFPNESNFSLDWYKAMALTKKAVYITCQKFYKALENRNLENLPIRKIKPEVINSLINASDELIKGEYFTDFIVPAIQGGAGTSINMNINEILTNRALQLLGSHPGDYSLIDPFEDANVYQSTNDVVPTALKIASMKLLLNLEEAINDSRKQIENLEKKHRHNLRLAYTQMQAAVPSSWGILFSSYSDALSRDWWRVSKALERIKVVNIGGGAIGTGISIPRYYIMEVLDVLKDISRLPITRAENLSDATSNLDVFVEVHAILKAHAVNLEKISSDLRLLSSDMGDKTLQIPQNQVGSSIMPGKVNPVITEYIISVSHQVYANDNLISGLAGLATLELNAYLPSIGNAIISSLNLLISANSSFKHYLIEGIKIDVEKSKQKLFDSPSISTALIPYIGYHKASELAKLMTEKSISIVEANNQLNILPSKKLSQILEPQNLLKQGFSVSDLE